MRPYNSPRIPVGGTSLEIDLSKRLLPTRALGGPNANHNIHFRENGNSSLSTSIYNLTNNVAGVGILTLASGKAASGTGWIPSIAISCGLAYASASTFILIGKACEISGEKSFRGLGSYAFGSGVVPVLVDSMIFISCFMGCALYIGCMGDIFTELFKNDSNIGMGMEWTSDTNMDMLRPLVASRSRVILLLTTSILLPLDLVKNLSALRFTSMLGVCAVVYTVSFMVLRALDGSYSAVGRFVLDGSITPPSFEGSTLWSCGVRSLVLVSNLGLAFVAHYNAPTYYRELKKENYECFPSMVYQSYWILGAIYVATMCAGYSTFGDTAQGNILLNYHPKDKLGFVARLATGFSVIFGFPLVSNGAREGFKNTSMALGNSSVSDPENNVKVVLGMLACASLLAILVEDINIIAGFSGALFGSALVYIYPPFLYTRILKKYYGKESSEYRRGKRSLLFVPLGIFIALMGAIMTFKSM